MSTMISNDASCSIDTMLTSWLNIIKYFNKDRKNRCSKYYTNRCNKYYSQPKCDSINTLKNKKTYYRCTFNTILNNLVTVLWNQKQTADVLAAWSCRRNRKLHKGPVVQAVSPANHLLPPKCRTGHAALRFLWNGTCGTLTGKMEVGRLPSGTGATD